MVLRADVWREHLLEKERDLTNRINEIDSNLESDEFSKDEKDALSQQKDKLSTELKEIFGKLQDIESDKAESK